MDIIERCTSPQYSSASLCGILTSFLETTLKGSQNGTVYLFHPLFIQHLLQSRCSPGAWSPNKQQWWETSNRTRHICPHMHHTCKYVSYTKDAHMWQPWKGAWKPKVLFQSVGSKSSVKVFVCWSHHRTRYRPTVRSLWQMLWGKATCSALFPHLLSACPLSNRFSFEDKLWHWPSIHLLALYKKRASVDGEHWATQITTACDEKLTITIRTYSRRTSQAIMELTFHFLFHSKGSAGLSYNLASRSPSNQHLH